MTTKPLTTQRYSFYTTQLNPMTDAQIAKQHGLSLDELEDWKEKNSIQPKGVSVEEKKHSRTVSILDKNKPPLTLELYKGYKELAKPISDSAIGNEHGMSVGDMQKFKREHDLIGKYGKNTKEAVEKRAEPVENVTAAPEAKKLPEIVRIKEKALDAVEEPQAEEFKPDAFEDENDFEKQLADKVDALVPLKAKEIVLDNETTQKLMQQFAQNPQLTLLSENPDFTTFRNDYVPSDAQAAEMEKLQKKLDLLEKENEWLENRHVQDTEIVGNVNAEIIRLQQEREQQNNMDMVLIELKNERQHHAKRHGFDDVPHDIRMTRILGKLGTVATPHETKVDADQYSDLLELASEVLAHAEQLRSKGQW